MDDELVFYTNPMSRAQIVRWMLEEVGQPYRAEVLSYPQMKSPAYLAVNPMGKVPAVRHRGQVVTEGAAICSYLADAFPEAALAPAPGSPERGAYYRWLFFAAGPLEAAITNRALKYDVRPEQSRSLGYGTLEATLETLEAELERALAGSGYLVGDRFSAVDLFLASQLSFPMQFGVLEKRPAFERYVEQFSARPARQRALEIDNRLIAEAKAAAG
jgi:glutathione S-transferase